MAFRRLRRTGDMNKLSRSLIKIPYELSGGIVIRERECNHSSLFLLPRILLCRRISVSPRSISACRDVRSGEISVISRICKIGKTNRRERKEDQDDQVRSFAPFVDDGSLLLPLCIFRCYSARCRMKADGCRDGCKSSWQPPGGVSIECSVFAKAPHVQKYRSVSISFEYEKIRDTYKVFEK